MTPPARVLSAAVLALIVSDPALAQGRGSVLDTSQVFQIGAIEVVALQSRDSGVIEEKVGAAALRHADRTDYARGIARVPGVMLSSGGSRNEAGVYLRGFDLRQVPLFVDGVPVYVPYDGNVDLRRFTTFDVSEISVSKGFSSVLYGPNALGGAINVLSLRPTARLDVKGGTGWYSGDGVQSHLNAGTRRRLWYLGTGGSWLRERTFPLAAGFRPVGVQRGGDRANAKREDWRASVKLGCTPNATDEYALVVARQRGVKGSPPYAGGDPTQKVRYWRWPQWDKDNAYLITQTAIGARSLFKGRLYYDHFRNRLFAYDDATYTTQNRRSSFRSIYDDPSGGGSLEWSLTTGDRNTLRAAVHSRYDVHNERNVGEPLRTCRELSYSFAAEDAWRAREGLTVIAGASLSRRETKRAEDFVDDGKTVVGPVPLGSGRAWNGELALLRDAWRGTVRASVAYRTRFPTLKDRYSAHLYEAVPNPMLGPENATHWELAWTGVPLAHVRSRVAAFYSRISDLIQRVDGVAVDGEGNPLYQIRNAGDARHMGFEVGLDASPARALTFGASYSHVDRKNLTNPDVLPTETPKSMLSAYADVAPSRWLNVVASVDAYGTRYSKSNGWALSPFAVVSLMGTARLVEGVALEVGVTNLLDESYQLDEGFPEPGRVYHAGLDFALSR